MKRLVIIILALAICECTPAFATTQSIDFSPGGDKPGFWHYDGAGSMSFYQGITIDRANNYITDTLVGSSVYIPALTIGEGPVGSYTIKPKDHSVLTIRGADSTIYLKATLNTGDLVPVGGSGVAYSGFSADLTDVYITAAGKALNSRILNSIANLGSVKLDFALTLQGATGDNYTSFAKMLSGGYEGMGGFSGAITVPEPATIALLGLGSLALLRKRRQKMK